MLRCITSPVQIDKRGLGLVVDYAKALEWDEAKRVASFERYGLDFADADTALSE